MRRGNTPRPGREDSPGNVGERGVLAGVAEEFVALDRLLLRVRILRYFSRCCAAMQFVGDVCAFSRGCPESLPGLSRLPSPCRNDGPSWGRCPCPASAPTALGPSGVWSGKGPHPSPPGARGSGFS